MDPNATWSQLAEAIEQDDWGTAGELADALYDWLSKGGFAPKITGKPAFDAIVARATCEGICAWDV